MTFDEVLWFFSSNLELEILESLKQETLDLSCGHLWRFSCAIKSVTLKKAIRNIPQHRTISAKNYPIRILNFGTENLWLGSIPWRIEFLEAHSRSVKFHEIVFIYESYIFGGDLVVNGKYRWNRRWRWLTGLCHFVCHFWQNISKYKYSINTVCTY